MSRGTIVVSVNASWNIFNFRKDLLVSLQHAGFDVVALAPEDSYSARLAEHGIGFIPLAIDKQGVSPLRDLMLFVRYRRALTRIKPDIFLGYTIKPNVYGSLAARALGIPVINNVSGLGTAFIRRGLLTRIATRLYRLALRDSHTVFFQNRDDRDLFIAKRMIRAEQARLLPGSGIDLDHFNPAPLSAQRNEFIFLFVGRLLWDKGVGEFVEAARRLRIIRPEARFQILGFLDVPNRSAVSRAELQSWVAEGLIDYLPACDDVRPHVVQADCIVLPSYREGLPRTLLEGAAMGRPLIASDVPGCRDIVEHQVNGLLCRVGDAAALADAMLEMMETRREDREKMGRQGRALAEARFDQKIVFDLYRAAIEDALGRNPEHA